MCKLALVAARGTEAARERVGLRCGFNLGSAALGDESLWGVVGSHNIHTNAKIECDIQPLRCCSGVVISSKWWSSPAMCKCFIQHHHLASVSVPLCVFDINRCAESHILSVNQLRYAHRLLLAPGVVLVLQKTSGAVPHANVMVCLGLRYILFFFLKWSAKPHCTAACRHVSLRV